MLLTELKSQYLSHVIANMKNGGPTSTFPINDFLSPDDNLEFKNYKDQVSELSEVYIKIKEYPAGQFAEQVRSILSKLKDITDEGAGGTESYIAFKKFFMELDYKNMPAELQVKFDEGINFLEKKISFFCSYTSRELPDINSSYEQTLTNYFGINKQIPEEFKKWNEVNYVAKMIVRYLNELGSHNYFFDRDKLVNGDEIKHEVFDYCKRTIAFVTLAQQQVFKEFDGKTNWCYEEYDHYKATHEQDFIYIVYKTPDLEKPLIGKPAIKQWFDYIATDKGILGTTIAYNESKQGIRNLVIKDAKIINKKYDEFFSNLVNSIN